MNNLLTHLRTYWLFTLIWHSKTLVKYVIHEFFTLNKKEEDTYTVNLTRKFFSMAVPITSSFFISSFPVSGPFTVHGALSSVPRLRSLGPVTHQSLTLSTGPLGTSPGRSCYESRRNFSDSSLWNGLVESLIVQRFPVLFVPKSWLPVTSQTL